MEFIPITVTIHLRNSFGIWADKTFTNNYIILYDLVQWTMVLESKLSTFDIIGPILIVKYIV